MSISHQRHFQPGIVTNRRKGASDVRSDGDSSSSSIKFSVDILTKN